MLTFDDKKGKAIGMIKGGINNGKLLSISDNYNNSDNFSNNNKKNKKKEYNELFIDDGELFPIPNIDERQVSYIAGPSGSGKSTYASNYIEAFKKLFPKKEIYVFSRKDEDPAFDRLKLKRIDINQDLIDNPIDIQAELPNGGLLIFDDVSTIRDDKLRKEVMSLMEDIMEIGRSLGVYVLITNHLVIPNEKKFARTTMNEMQSLTVFPKSGSAQQIKYALSTYFGLDKKQIERILSLPSRWVTVHKNYPQTVIYSKGAYIL